MNYLKPFRTAFIICLAAGAPLAKATEPLAAPQDTPPSGTVPTLTSETTNVWANGIGGGFQRNARTYNLEAGGAYGLNSFGSRQSHHLALVSLSTGRMIGPVVGAGHWFRGNWEVRGELFGGAQVSPSTEWLVGLTGHLRYNFATGTRLIPFLDLGEGILGTSIDRPDLSTAFEFNTQGGLGTHWLLSERMALTLEAKYIHISNAGISHPNFGVNSVIGLAGLTWFF